MKKITLLMLTLLVSVITFAQKPAEAPAPTVGVAGLAPKEAQTTRQMVARQVQGTLPAVAKNNKRTARRAALSSVDELVGTYVQTYASYFDNGADAFSTVTIAKGDAENSIVISGWWGSYAENLNATVDLSTGEISIPFGQLIYEYEGDTSAYFADATKSGDEALTGALIGQYADGVIEFGGYWEAKLDGSNSAYVIGYNTVLEKANGIMMWTYNGSTTGTYVRLQQSEDAKTLVVKRFGGFSAAVEITMFNDKTFEIPSQLVNSSSNGDFYTYSLTATGSYDTPTIYGSATEDVLTFGSSWTARASTGYWYGNRGAATIRYTDGTKFQFPEIPEVATTPAAPSITDFLHYSEYGAAQITVSVPKVDVDGKDIRTELLSYQIFSDINGTEAAIGDVRPYAAASETVSLAEVGEAFNTYTRIGVQSIYTAAGETNKSEITWLEIPQLVTVPEGATTTTQPFLGQLYTYNSGWTNAADSRNVEVAVKDNEVYVKGFFSSWPESWIKGTVEGEKVVFKSGQFLGQTTAHLDQYFTGYFNSDNTAIMDAEFVYNAEDPFLLASTSILCLSYYPDEISMTNYYRSGVVIGTDIEPVAVELPEGLEAKTMKFRGTLANNGNAFSQTAQVAVDGNDVYFKGISSSTATGWVKGTKDGNVVTLKSPQLLATGRYQIGYDAETGRVGDAVMEYNPDTDTYTFVTNILDNADKYRTYFYRHYAAGSTIGAIPVAVNIAPESGSITEAITTALDGDIANTVQVTLTEGVEYTLEKPIEAKSTIIITGNGATIDASGIVEGEGEDAKDAPVFRMNPYIYDNELNAKGYKIVPGVLINGVTFKGVKNYFFFDNGKKYVFNQFIINNSVIELATATNLTSAIQLNGGGAIEFTMQNSSVYQTGEANVSYFTKYNNSVVPDNGVADYTASNFWTYKNNTFYNVASNQWHNGGRLSQKASTMTVDVENNVWVDCADGQILRRMFGSKSFSGFAEGSVVKNNTFWSTKTGAVAQGGYGDNQDLDTDPYLQAAWDTEAEAVSLAVHEGTRQDVEQLGDPRWGNWTSPNMKKITLIANDHATVTTDAYGLQSMPEKTIQFTATLEQGYKLGSLLAKVGQTKLKVTEVDAQKNIYSLVMPEFDITVEPQPEVTPTDFVIDIAPDQDIAAAIKAETEGKDVLSMIINLEKGNYTLTSTIVSPGKLVINGNGATIDASAVEVTTGEGETATTASAPFLALSSEPKCGFAPKADGSGDTDYYLVSLVQVKDVTVNGLKNSIFYDNNTKYVVANFTLDNTVFNLATEAVQNEALISFQGGGAKDFTISNSTFVGNNEVAKYFVRYNNAARLDRYGYDTSAEYMNMNYKNNTFYGLLKSDGQWGNYNGVSGYARAAFDVENNIWYNCGNDIIRRMAGGRFNGSNPTTFVANTYFNGDADISASEASYDKSGTALKYNPYFKNAAKGDFALGLKTEQVELKTGDQRWGTWGEVGTDFFKVTVAEDIENGTVEAPEYVLLDDEVALTVTPAEGYEVKTVTAKMGKSPLTLTDDYKFYMPAYDVDVTAEFALATYTVTVAEGIENGTVAADKTEAQMGDVITLTITPADGYKLDELTVTDADGAAVEVSADNTFTMPAKNVTITATFKAVTGIQSVKAADLEDAVIYNLQGQRVEKAQAKGGVFIVNGHKVAIK